MNSDISNKDIVLFDGVCNLCNGFVQFVLKHKKKDSLLFASIQSNIGQSLLKEHGINSNVIDSIVFIHNNKAFIKSKAVFSVLQSMKSPWNVLVIFKILPSFVSDFFYDLVAKYRYRLFGKRESCWLPTHEHSSHFLND